jgi:hypothetical protein
MAAAPSTAATLAALVRGSCRLTLLELVRAVAEVTEDDREIVATVAHMLKSGHVRLTGNFRDTPIEFD